MPASQNAGMRAFHADHTEPRLPPGHRFPMHKYRLLREAVARELPQLQVQAADPASEGELALVHAPSYVAAVLEGWLTAQQQREIGFPWSPGMAERSRRSVGATVMAARAALAEGVAANLAGGTHHAGVAQGGGFCVFNDIAVAARLMQAEAWRHAGRNLRVAVIDLDVHQGNGTAEVFSDDPSVYTLSIHGAKNFPFRKVASDLDVDLPDACGDEVYLAALDRALAQLWAEHRERHDRDPDLLFYQAGVDVLAGDRLGRFPDGADEQQVGTCRSSRPCPRRADRADRVRTAEHLDAGRAGPPALAVRRRVGGTGQTNPGLNQGPLRE